MNTRELIHKAIDTEHARASFLNPAILEISKSTKKKPGFVKFAVSDETAGAFMMGEKSLVGIVLMIDQGYVNQLLGNGPEAIEATESPSEAAAE